MLVLLGEMVAIMNVLVSPPSESWRRRVSFESLESWVSRERWKRQTAYLYGM